MITLTCLLSMPYVALLSYFLFSRMFVVYDDPLPTRPQTEIQEALITWVAGIFGITISGLMYAVADYQHSLDGKIPYLTIILYGLLVGFFTVYRYGVKRRNEEEHALDKITRPMYGGNTVRIYTHLDKKDLPHNEWEINDHSAPYFER